MAPSITAAGPIIDTYAQIVSDLLNGTTTVPGFYQIYGPSINVASNSPDGQMINIFALAKQDMENFDVAIYDSFDPDQAIGVSLDSIAQIAGLSRKSGTYTQVAVNVTVSATLTLSGLDTSTPFTISDGSGNQYNLIVSTTFYSGTTASANFQAVSIGFIQCLPSTLTTMITIVSGVTSVTNPSSPYQVGSNQETDANFRLRRQASTAFPAQGPLQAMYAGLNQVSGIAGCAVYENSTGSTVNGIPAHGIWVVVNGGTAAQVALAIYNYRNLGCPMKGSQSSVVTQIDGSTVTMYWDNVVLQPLYIKAQVDSINSSSVSLTAIQEALVTNWQFNIYQAADISTLNQQIRAINPNALCSNLGVSADGTTWVNLLSPSSQQNQFYLVAANITLTS